MMLASAMYASDTRTRRLDALVFYLFVPLINAFLFGWMRAGRTALWPRELSLLYWLGNIFIFWLLSDALARLLALAQGRRQMPLWLLLVLSNLGVGFLALPLVSALAGLLQPLLPPGLPTSVPQPFEISRWIAGSIPGMGIWVGVNLLLFGYQPQSEASTEATTVPSEARLGAGSSAASVPAGVPPAQETPFGFLQKVRPQRRGDLLALKAEGHYLRVITTRGEDLVLYRFSQALNEVAQLPGGQVHRSWWVARDAVRHPVGTDRLILKNDLEVPFSRSFRLVARREGVLSVGG
jgi:hypothetical protein